MKLSTKMLAISAVTMVGIALTTVLNMPKHEQNVVTVQSVAQTPPKVELKEVKLNEVKADEVKQEPKEITNYDKAYYVLKKYVSSTELEISDKEISKYASHYAKYTEQYDVRLEDALAMGWTESRFNQKAIGGSGEIGIMQILPSTAKTMGVSKVELKDPEVNIRTGIKYLSYIKSHYELDRRMAIIAYNQGIGNVSRGTYRTWYFKKVNGHSKDILKVIAEMAGDK